MYNPSDYAAKKQQVRRQRRTIVTMVAVMGVMAAVYVAQCREADRAAANAWQWREQMWAAQERCDSLQHEIGMLNAQIMYDEDNR